MDFYLNIFLFCFYSNIDRFFFFCRIKKIYLKSCKWWIYSGRHKCMTDFENKRSAMELWILIVAFDFGCFFQKGYLLFFLFFTALSMSILVKPIWKAFLVGYKPTRKANKKNQKKRWNFPRRFLENWHERPNRQESLFLIS